MATGISAKTGTVTACSTQTGPTTRASVRHRPTAGLSGRTVSVSDPSTSLIIASTLPPGPPSQRVSVARYGTVTAAGDDRNDRRTPGGEADADRLAYHRTAVTWRGHEEDTPTCRHRTPARRRRPRGPPRERREAGLSRRQPLQPDRYRPRRQRALLHGLVVVLDFGYGRVVIHKPTGFTIGLMAHPDGSGSPFSELQTGLDHLGLTALATSPTTRSAPWRGS